MAYGMVSDEQRGKEHLKSMGVDVRDVQKLPAEEQSANMCRAFRAGCHQYMRPRYAFWTAAWVAFGVHTAIFDSKDLEKYAASTFGTVWGAGTMIHGRRKQKELEAQIVASLSTPRQG